MFTPVGFMRFSNFTAWDPANKDSNITLSNANRTAAMSTGVFDSGGVRNLLPKSIGKLYAELTLNVWTSGQSRGAFGIGTSAAVLADTYFWGMSDAISASYAETGGSSQLSANTGSTAISATALAQGQVISIAVDIPNHRIYWANNGTWQNSANPGAGTGYVDYITTSPIYLLCGLRHGASGSAEQATLNTGGASFAYAPPSGFVAWG